MTSSNHYSSLYPFPIDLNEDDPLQHQSFKPQLSSSSSSSSSSFTCRVSINPTVQDQEEEKIFVPRDAHKERVEVETRQSHENTSSAKWMPLKMRILKKMMSSDQPNQQPPSSSPHNNNNNNSNNNFLSYNNNNNTIRVCSDCNTTKTPLWRSGPRGPKSLCNACGIRQRKARRAMAAATAAAANETVVAAETTTTTSTKTSKIHYKAKRSSNNCVPRFKNKKCKLNSKSQSRNKLCFEELRIMLSKNSAFHQVFPQDEKEAAILLMALSYGLAVHG